MQLKSGIYKIVNTINNKIYIGDSKMIYVDEIQGKIQELKQYLDEANTNK